MIKLIKTGQNTYTNSEFTDMYQNKLNRIDKLNLILAVIVFLAGSYASIDVITAIFK